MASESEVGAGGGAATRRVVLPITSRGPALSDRVCWSLLAAAMAASAALILWLNRGTTFSLDEMDFVEASPGLDPIDVLDPHNGHLVATTRLVYKGLLETVGAEYIAFRVLGVAAVLLTVGVFYALVKRRIGAVAALAPAVVLLFFGAAWGHVVVPIGFTDLLSIACGLGALLALERRDRRGDIAACALITLSIATFTIGIAFLVGIAVIVLARPDRARRAWIFVIPTALYGAWWLYSLPIDSPAEPQAKASNVLLIPSYVADSLATVVGALVGLNYDFSDPSSARSAPGWGQVLAVPAVLALAWRMTRRRVPVGLWAALAILLAYWSLTALAVEPLTRTPGEVRYMFMGATGVLLVATAAAAGTRLSGTAIAILFAVAGISLVTNIALLRDGASRFRDDYSSRARAQFTALELARGEVDPGFDPAAAVSSEISPVSSPAGTYFAARDRYGSLAYTPEELQREDERTRAVTDAVLAEALGLRSTTSDGSQPSRGCDRIRDGGPGTTLAGTVPPGGARLSIRGPGSSEIALGRFSAEQPVALGELAPGDTATLRAPTGSSPVPWRVSATDARELEVCPL